MGNTIFYRCFYETFGANDDHEYRTELVQDEESPFIDPGFVEFSYRAMKGVHVVAIVASPEPPTLEEFARIVRIRVKRRMQDVLNGKE